MENVLIELRAATAAEVDGFISQLKELKIIELDSLYKPTPITRKLKARNESKTWIIRGKMEKLAFETILALPFVLNIWDDPEIAPDCLCNGSKKGTLDDVAKCLGAKVLWNKNIDGTGVWIGIVDAGVSKEIFGSRLVGGSNADWGTVILENGHGNMCATDASGIAPQAQLYDLRIFNSPTSLASNSMMAYEWALQNFVGSPSVLSNSWSLVDPYSQASTDINHPLNQKVQEVIDNDIKIVFSAGNCGKHCSHGCKKKGAGSVWGPNSLEEVMTVGAVKLNNHLLKYSSQGPGVIYSEKPNFCSYSSFKGYFPKDSGTSAACPVVAGAVALMLNYDSSLAQAQIKGLFQQTCKDIDASGFDYYTGYGVIRLDDAYYELEPTQRPAEDFREKLCDYVYNTERNCVQWADEGSNECSHWADQGSNQCSDWADQGSNQCCTWWPCSWGCKAFYWVSNWVCQAWYWVANWVCQGWYWLAKWVCKAYVQILVSVTLTNCKCR